MLRPSDVSKKVVEDFHLAAAVKMALTREGMGEGTTFIVILPLRMKVER